MGADLIAVIKPILKELLAGMREGGEWCAEFSVTEDASLWIQVIPDAVNFSYPFPDEPGGRLRTLGISMIPGMEVVAFKPGTYATLGISAFDLEQVAQFVDALLTRFYLLSDDAPLHSQLTDLG